jgi:hypothetical protein
MSIHLVGYGVDTLILNVRYTDKHAQPVKQELDEKLAGELDDLLDYADGDIRFEQEAEAKEVFSISKVEE